MNFVVEAQTVKRNKRETQLLNIKVEEKAFFRLFHTLYTLSLFSLYYLNFISAVNYKLIARLNADINFKKFYSLFKR